MEVHMPFFSPSLLCGRSLLLLGKVVRPLNTDCRLMVNSHVEGCSKPTPTKKAERDALSVTLQLMPRPGYFYKWISGGRLKTETTAQILLGDQFLIFIY